MAAYRICVENTTNTSGAWCGSGSDVISANTTKITHHTDDITIVYNSSGTAIGANLPLIPGITTTNKYFLESDLDDGFNVEIIYNGHIELMMEG